MNRSKRKTDNENGDREGRCTAYNEKKHRFCRQKISKRVPEPFASEVDFKALYCGNHGNMYSTLLKDRKRQKVIHNDSKRGNRIPCPVDPSHMIYESNVKAHVTKCPKAKLASEDRQRKYYKHDINTGGCGEETFNSSKEDMQIDPKAFAIRILTAYKNTFLQSSSSEEDVDVTSLTEEEMYQAIPTQNYFPSEKKLGLESVITKHRVKIGGIKHLEQIGSLVGHARVNNLLEGADTVLEMGAGRATTGVVLSGVCAAKKGKKVKLVLVEKAGSRAKADTALRRDKALEEESKENGVEQDYFRLQDVDVQRIKCDLAHVSIPEALAEAEGKPLLCQEVNTKGTGTKNEKRNILVIAKHLCGAGTDLALKSIIPIKHRVSGYILATCCHGLCSWDLYVGRDFLGTAMCTNAEGTESSFGEHEFNLMKRWACGTVLGDRNGLDDAQMNDETTKKETDNEHATSCDDGTEDMSVTKVSNSMGLKCGPHGLGRACQRLIDYGRCDFLKNKLLGKTSGEVKLCHYVNPRVTPQNALLFCQAT
jgi:tRNA:m4X modification enzyme